MNLSAHVILRNVEMYQFPWRESILSLLPVVDEYLLCVCPSEDETAAAAKGFAQEYEKVRIIEGWWTEEDVYCLSELTNHCMDHCQGDWTIYIQADELFHEEQHPALRRWIRTAETAGYEALLFNVLHFWGDWGTLCSLDHVRCVRAAKRNSAWRSQADAFTMADGSDDWVEKAVQTDLQIYHYGFVRDPAIIAAKELRFQRMFVKRHGSLFPDPRVVEAAAANGERFYERFNDSLTFFPFEGTHPSPIRERVQTGVSWPTPWRTW